MMTAVGKWKVAAYLTAIFAAGMVSGWVVAGRESKTLPQPAPPPGPGPGFVGRSLTNSTIYKVDGLSAEQLSKIEGIFSKYQKAWDARRNAAMSKMREESASRNKELAEVLTPQQVEQWEKLRKEKEKNDHGPRNRGNRRSQESTNGG